MTALPDVFLRAPLAHRAYHDVSAGRPENSRAAIRAAVAAGYGIECDVQLSSDGVAMVFHDYDLGRLTAQKGPVAQQTARALGAIPLLGADDGIPTLAEVLGIVAGQVPLLIEIKDQDGAMGANIGPLEAAVAGALAGYTGPVAVMSFNPHSVSEMARLAPETPRGLTTCAYDADDWPLLNATVRTLLARIPDYDHVGASFISHDARDLTSGVVADLKAKGTPVLCWTIRSPEAETKAREVADNVTFEGYAAALPA
ncbi:glycerophosphoryl diester phosphodiesterase [Maritimibacter alkaliphilus HTCC2654]|uniref:Phosphodiesterase-like n=1 Tax=Maritimibacter alkaliphilus HTCC2654 TaxID=314271 RepID=A3VF37_9RHOB|nr:glycerophosphodiester phosphodiesterase family protein [Maritimibacter alkaliphilus]EAQ12952.1 phosphodiesterase-like [Rhodobacterales bacterium HTCC2654] [Maritimibacter alkaliphilus HTCC2654]TYP85056.1 glycerophosphoryl diester phosphodiesterase [Maritimibacter alkaliphilus HTCC2654]